MPEEKDKSPYIFKCPSCGANRVFSPKFQELFCPHCGNRQSFEINREITKRPYNSEAVTESNSSVNTGICVCSCSNCSAKTNVLNGDIASKCPFCGTTIITQKENLSGLKPDTCIPFTVDSTEAETYFEKWLRSKWFVPTALKKRVRANEINGVYSPCYGFDTNTASSYSGTLGKHYTVIVGSGKNQRVETRTRYFNISGNFDKSFINVMIECSPHFDQRVLDNIRPFAMERSAVYDNSFLSGFIAESYDKNLSQGWSEAKVRIDSDLRKSILSKYDYDVITTFNVSSAYNDMAYNYMLLPIYVSNYTFKQKVYNFFVNGNTGKTSGTVPRSFLKIMRMILIIAAIGVAMYFLFDKYLA